MPEGIIFQSQNAYKQLRKILVENYLWCVVSLPGGCFNPYSGVKTSILFLDKMLAKKTREILFVKVESDGFDLGAQRRPIEKNDLPEALRIIRNWTKGHHKDTKSPMAYAVSWERIFESGDFNLSGDRHCNTDKHISNRWSMVKLGEICEFFRGVTYNKGDESAIPTKKAVLRANNIDLRTHSLNMGDIKFLKESVDLPPEKKLKKSDIFICTASGSKEHLGKVAFVNQNMEFYFGGFMGVIRCKPQVLPTYLFYNLTSPHYDHFIQGLTAGVNINNLKGSDLLSFQIPLPPIDVQERVVKELNDSQKEIATYKKHIEQLESKIRGRIERIWQE